MLNTSEDPNWWVAKAKGGKEGMIPANYVELLPEGVGKLERYVLIYILSLSCSPFDRQLAHVHLAKARVLGQTEISNFGNSV